MILRSGLVTWIGLLSTLTIAQKCYAPGQGVDVLKRVKGSTTVIHGAVTFVGRPDETGLFNATILVKNTWSKKNDNLKNNIVLRVGQFGTHKRCPKVKARMSYIFFVRNTGEKKGRYRYYKVQLFPAYASEANLNRVNSLLVPKQSAKSLIPMTMESKSMVHSLTAQKETERNKAGCPVLEDPENGSISCLTNGRQCNFKCDPGYTMVGFHRKVCLPTKTWKPFKNVFCRGEDSIDMVLLNQASQIGKPAEKTKTDVKTNISPLKSKMSSLLSRLRGSSGPTLKMANQNDSPKTTIPTSPPQKSTNPFNTKILAKKPLEQNLKSAISTNGNSGRQMANIMEQLARMSAKPTSTTTQTTTTAPPDPFFLSLNDNECSVYQGQYGQNNRWNNGFEAYGKVMSKQKIPTGWILLVSFDTPLNNLKIWGNNYIVRKVSADRKLYAIRATGYKPIYPQMPLEVVFHAEYWGMGQPEAKVELYSECEGVSVPARPEVMSTRSPFTRKVVEPIQRQQIQRFTPVSAISMAPRSFARVNPNEIYNSTLTAKIGQEFPQCSEWQPAGRLPGAGQVFPRWISSVFKSAMRYDYNELMHKSLLFLEAQRSGKLNELRRNIPWRGDSGLKDGCMEGVDLDGGWYHGADHMKHSFQTAAASTVIFWGMIDFKEAYLASGELALAKEQMRWILDYFMKTHTAKYELYVQVGDTWDDSRYWGRAEEMDMDRPAYKIDPEHPGTDVAAETAAALAAGAYVFADEDAGYAARCLQHAKDLFEFAINFQGSYADHVNPGEAQKPQTGYLDELIWSAMWLYRVTSDEYYLEQAETIYAEANFYTPRVFSWDDKRAGNLVLLAQFTGKEKYKMALQQFMNWLIESAYRTPKGLVWLDENAPNRHAANAAFISLHAAKVISEYSTMYTNFAKKQVHYLLGDTGRSFVVGFGRNPPARPYHRGSSCPGAPTPCTWEDSKSMRTNPQVLFGALVAGPDRLDRYEDSRNPKMNDVGIDYTAGLMSAVAGLKNSVQTEKRYRIFGRWGG